MDRTLGPISLFHDTYWTAEKGWADGTKSPHEHMLDLQKESELSETQFCEQLQRQDELIRNQQQELENQRALVEQLMQRFESFMQNQRFEVDVVEAKTAAAARRENIVNHFM
ncbi:hypothetical protein PanWU01x14_110200 [Parasponia andersonii]|uniref:Uncharacterized protein n=1 Tax=Parasponia andersonii TaxID=3476 RepID=A0A2P5CZF9_PARAD|nr:hypothetical protein PanWU01x14_110200 [Parasponia andersonii]